MSIAADILSVVLKSVISNTVGDGLPGELMNLFTDTFSQKSIKKISRFIDGRKNKIKAVLSENSMREMGIPEENIDYVTAEIKDLLSVVEISDEILAKCNRSREELGNYLWNEYRKNHGSHMEQDRDIKKGLYIVADTLLELAKESENFEQECLKDINTSVNNVSAELGQLSDYLENNLARLDYNSREVLHILKMILERMPSALPEKYESRTQAYRDKWNSNMFLNDYDRHDDTGKVNIKLSDVYLEPHLPHYVWGKNKRIFKDLKETLSEHIYEETNNKMLLILGQPGIGKSTLITWITANFEDSADNILVYKFASDLKQIKWEKNNPSVFDEILTSLNLTENALAGKTLILDGFDEVNAGNARKEVLDNIYNSIAHNLNIKGFSLIITCRENYIQGLADVMCQYLTLQPWDEDQIRSFSSAYQSRTNISISEGTIRNVIANKDILGIPLILYMVLALEIVIEKEGSIVDVYDKIFSIEKGIYDRCIENRGFADSHRISAIKREIHQVSRDIAIWMFENNPDEASVPKEEYLNICKAIVQDQLRQEEDSVISQDLLIGSYFKVAKHCEGLETKVYFVHRSIYEYFVAETIFTSIESAMRELSPESQKKFAANIAKYLKVGTLSVTICQYLEYKITKLRSELTEEKKKRFYKWWEDAIGKMMDKGMFYYCESISHYKNLIFMEVRCFKNLVMILRLILSMEVNNKKYKYIMYETNRESLENYIRYCSVVQFIWRKQGIFEKLDLEKMYLANLDLHDINLQEANLSKTCLVEADLTEANLTLANLQEACMREADLRNADLRGANLRDADLREADLRGTLLTCLMKVNKGNLKVRGQKLKDANLKDARINNSIWRKNDVRPVKQLEQAIFTCLILERKNGQELQRSAIFLPQKPVKNNKSK